MSGFRAPGETGSGSKYRSTSTTSLPRSPTGMEPSNLPERKLGRSMRSSSMMQISDTDMDHKNKLKELNTRLVSYVGKVRKLQMATDVIDSLPRNQGIDEQSFASMKQKYEIEIHEWKEKLNEAQNNIAQLKIEIDNLGKDKKTLNAKINDKQGILRERDAHIANLEVEINEVLSKLNILQNEKGKLMDNEAVYKSDINDLKKEFEESRRNFDKEKMRNAELENQLGALDKEMKFKIQLLETEIQEERSKNKFDFNAIERKLQNDYENRLGSEMESLRRVYEEQTEKAKNEYMLVHSDKLTELQEHLSRERSNAMSGRTEIEDWKSRLERSKSVINQLESDKIVMQQQLQQQVADLSSKLEEQGATFRSQLMSKDHEVGLLQKDMTKLRSQYEKLIEIKQGLDLEISTYKEIIDGEEKRIRKVSNKFSRMTSKSNYESFSDSDGEIKGYRAMDEIDGRTVYVDSKHQSHVNTSYQSKRTSRSSRSQC